MNKSPAEIRAAHIADDTDRILTAIRAWLALPDNNLPKLAEVVGLPATALSVAIATADFAPIVADELSALRLLAFFRNVELDAEEMAMQARAAGNAVLFLPPDPLS